MIKRINRRRITLIEVLIAMALTMMIMTTLAYFYRQIDQINQETEIQQEKLFGQLYLSTRLSDVIPKIVSPSNEKKDFYFFQTNSGNTFMKEGSPNLVFTFDNGVKLDPQFSNHVLGRLFVDKRNRLCLAVWPSPYRWEEFHPPSIKCEVLEENIAELEFEFYIPPKRDLETVWKQAKMNVKIPEGFPQSEAGEWLKEWPASYEQLPAMLKLNMKSTVTGKPFTLTFPLPNSNFFILYNQ